MYRCTVLTYVGLNFKPDIKTKFNKNYSQVKFFNYFIFSNKLKQCYGTTNNLYIYI